VNFGNFITKGYCTRQIPIGNLRQYVTAFP